MTARGSSEGPIAVAMSGGVDSAVAALLLQEAGHEVIGFFLRNGVAASGAGASRSCCSASDAADARRTAARLDVPFYAIDVAREFRGIVTEFVAAYRAGRTPNPCVACNSEVKFGRLLDLARRIGAPRVATGHYARLERQGGRQVLRRARDAGKDQSYVLAMLGQQQLARAEFPLGELTKSEVRARARAAGLPVADKAESQEICFVPGGDYRQVVAERSGPEPRGELVATDGTVLGGHAGVSGFTVGQRRGLGVALGARRHVVRIEAAAGRVVIGTRDEASAGGFELDEVNFVALAPPPPGAALRVVARVRHRHEGAPAHAEVLAGDRLRVRFDAPEFAVTPGQLAVLYAGDAVLAAGPIARVLPDASSASPSHRAESEES